MPDATQLDRSMTINEIVAAFPQTIAVFNRFGFDTCCGGGVTVDEAAKRDGIDPDVVSRALHDSAEQR